SVVPSHSTYSNTTPKHNPTDRSRWIVHTLTTAIERLGMKEPPTMSVGLFAPWSGSSVDLKEPPTASVGLNSGVTLARRRCGRCRRAASRLARHRERAGLARRYQATHARPRRLKMPP